MADKAYFKKPILDDIKEIGAKPYIPVSAAAYKIDEEKFSYNKDSDEWFCVQGNKTEIKKYYKDKREKEYYKYYFEKEKCRNCPLRENCVSGTRCRKSFSNRGQYSRILWIQSRTKDRRI